MQPWEAKNTVTLTVSLTSIFLRGRGILGIPVQKVCSKMCYQVSL